MHNMLIKKECLHSTAVSLSSAHTEERQIGEAKQCIGQAQSVKCWSWKELGLYQLRGLGDIS